MVWNWQQKHWPKFTYDTKQLESFEREYMQYMGMLKGTMQHLTTDDNNEIVVRILSIEGVKTSEIEGEMFNRESIQSSIRRKLGLSSVKRNIEPAEAGVAEMMVHVYENYDAPLKREELHHWNAELMQGRTDLEHIGAYRTHNDPMHIVSGGLGMETIHFEAPPSKDIPKEMKRFIQWFNRSQNVLPSLTRAGIAHLYSVCIHPYEDGNGRMARAITEKSLSQSAGTPALSGLSRQIVAKKPMYYDALEKNNRDLNITDWLLYFAQTTIEAKVHTITSVDRVLEKAALYSKYHKELNDRQKKVVDKLYEAEPDGFKGGLSAKNYIVITNAPRATTTRDLQNLVNLGILNVSGKGRYTRYNLAHHS